MATANEQLRILGSQAAGYKGVVHGDTADGAIDIEFPDIYSASMFGHIMTGDDEMFGKYLLSADIRDGMFVTSLTQPVTLTVYLNPEYDYS